MLSFGKKGSRKARRRASKKQVSTYKLYHAAISFAADNNPGAISNQLFRLQIIPEPEILDSDEVYEVLKELYNQGRIEELRRAIAVPANPTAGNYTVEFIPWLSQAIQESRQQQ